MITLLRRSGLVGALCAAVLILPAQPAEAADCNCVTYVRHQTGLPGGPSTAAGYTEAKMRQFGYRKVSPAAGTILVWNANTKGAHGLGHIAVVSSANYDSRLKQWTITVRHANWGGCGIRTKTFVWNDLRGVNAYRK